MLRSRGRFGRPGRSALALLGLLSALLLSEGLVRVVAPNVRDHVVPSGLLEYNSELGWSLRPGQDRQHHAQAFDVRYVTNSWGDRDVARVAARTPGRTRIFLFGDSQVFGWGVDAAKRFPDRVERMQPDLEIWNRAVPGYGLDQEVLAYERVAASVPSDEVVFWLSERTLSRCGTSRIYQKDKPRFELGRGGELELRRIPPLRSAWSMEFYGLLGRLYLTHFVEVGLARLPQTGEWPRQERDARLAPLATAILERGLRHSIARHEQMTVLVELRRAAASGGTDEFDSLSLERWGASHGVAVVPLLFPQPLPPWALPSDGHWNEAAHALIADEWLAARACRTGGEPLRR